MKRSEFLNDLRAISRAIRNDIQQHFYFLESEELRRRPGKGKWNVIEVFAHINLVQAYYIENITRALEGAQEVNHDEVKFSWVGKQLINSMQPTDGAIKFKMKTFKKIDPLYRSRKKGIVVDEKVVFRDLINDIEELEELMIKSYDYEIDSVKLPTIIKFIRINIADAFAFVLAHTERHLLQAKKIIDQQ